VSRVTEVNATTDERLVVVVLVLVSRGEVLIVYGVDWCDGTLY